MDVLVSDIYVDNEFNSRDTIRLTNVKELATQIRDNGQIHEVTIIPYGKDGFRYKLVAGFRRYHAIAKLLRWKTIRANLREDVDNEQAQLINLTENLERKELNCLEEAKMLGRLYPEFKYSVTDVAERLSRTPEWVSSRRILLDQSYEVQMMFASGRIPISRIKSIKSLDTEEEKLKLCEELTKRTHARQPMTNIRKRTMTDCKKMIEYLINAGLTGLPTQLLGWVNGYVSDERIYHEIDTLVKEGRERNDGLGFNLEAD